MTEIPHSDLTTYDVEVLEMLGGERPGEWGAWVAACLEELSDRGLCTHGLNYRITDAGREALAARKAIRQGKAALDTER